MGLTKGRKRPASLPEQTDRSENPQIQSLDTFSIHERIRCQKREDHCVKTATTLNIGFVSIDQRFRIAQHLISPHVKPKGVPNDRLPYPLRPRLDWLCLLRRSLLLLSSVYLFSHQQLDAQPYRPAPAVQGQRLARSRLPRKSLGC